jgi:hypothetical protein
MQHINVLKVMEAATLREIGEGEKVWNTEKRPCEKGSVLIREQLYYTLVL